MKIVFDLTPIYDHLTGVERYNINITREIILHHPENQYTLLFKNEVHKEFNDISKQDNVENIIIPAKNKFLFIQVSLLIVLSQIDADYYIFLSFTSPILFKKGKIINAIHDLTCWDYPETIPTKMKYYYRLTYGAAVKHSWKIVTVSKFSQRRICEHYKLGADKVPVIYNGLTNIFVKNHVYNKELRQEYNLPDKYILSLSTLEPRKNLQLLIRAYKELVDENREIPALVLAGRQGWKLEEITDNISDEVKCRIHFIGFVDDEDLPQLYREADFFVFPSKYEGFGLPVIEAMSQGTLVITSDAASLPEITKNACLMFSSNDIDDLKCKIMKFYSLSQNEKNAIISKGRIVSNSYSWKNEAEKLFLLLDGS